MPRGDRERIAVAGRGEDCDAALSYPRRPVREGRSGERPIVPAAWSLAAYGSSFLDAFDMDTIRAAWRRAWDDAASRPPDLAARFDVRIHDGKVVHARDGCAPEDLEARFFLHVEPADPADLPEDRRRYGFDNRDFEPRFVAPAYPWPSARPFAMRLDGRCLVSTPLPGYPVRRVRTGQIVRDDDGGWRSLWEGGIDLDAAGRR